MPTIVFNPFQAMTGSSAAIFLLDEQQAGSVRNPERLVKSALGG
jgi:hypothetical protein